MNPERVRAAIAAMTMMTARRGGTCRHRAKSETKRGPLRALITQGALSGLHGEKGGKIHKIEVKTQEKEAKTQKQGVNIYEKEVKAQEKG